MRDARGGVADSYDDDFLGLSTNGSHHPHPWLATVVTMIVLGLVIVIIILFADSLNAL
jgi:heme exporter protein D